MGKLFTEDKDLLLLQPFSSTPEHSYRISFIEAISIEVLFSSLDLVFSRYKK